MNKQETQRNDDQENEKVLADGPSKSNLKKMHNHLLKLVSLGNSTILQIFFMVIITKD